MKKNRSVHALIFTSIVFMLPVITFAAGQELSTGFTDIGRIVNVLTNTVVRALATLFATLAMVAFFYGIVQYIWGVRDGKPEKVKEGNKFMINGLLALFVMFSVWGIITYVQKIFGITGNTIVIPEVIIKGQGAADPGAGAGSPDCFSIASEVQREACFAKKAGGGGTNTIPDYGNTGPANQCEGKKEGTPCSLPGVSVPTYCQVDDGQYNQAGMNCSAGNPCGSGQYPGPNGCQASGGGVD